MLLLASEIGPEAIKVDDFGWALVAALVASAVERRARRRSSGTNDDDTYTLRVVQRIARRQGRSTRTDIPGIIFLEIDGLALPVLRRAMRDGNAPTLASWLAAGTHRLVEWEPDLSSQTGASQAGILLGSNEDIPAFRWVDKETGRVIACSGVADCAEIESERTRPGSGLLVNGGSSRGNLFSGEAEEAILTVEPDERREARQPGLPRVLRQRLQRHADARALLWEIVLEWTAALRAIRRDVRPRGHRGGVYSVAAGGDLRRRPRPDRLRRAHRHDARPARRLRDVLELRRGRAPLRPGAADTLEALRKLDQQFGRIDQARRYAPRPYQIVVLSDHGQTQGATFKQRNGYSLEDLVGRSLESGDGAPASRAGTSRARRPRSPSARRPAKGAKHEKPGEKGVSGGRASCSARATSGSST